MQVGVTPEDTAISGPYKGPTAGAAPTGTTAPAPTAAPKPAPAPEATPAVNFKNATPSAVPPAPTTPGSPSTGTKAVGDTVPPTTAAPTNDIVPPNSAGKLPTTPPTYAPAPNTGAAGGSTDVGVQLHDLIASGSPLLKQAEGNAIIAMNARGLQNSSLATQAADQAVIASAAPLAEQNASFAQQSQLLVQQLGNALNLTSAQQQNWLQQNQATLTDNLTTIKAQFGDNQAMAYASAASTLQGKFMDAITAIGTTQGLTPQQQQTAVQQLESQYQADLSGLSAYYTTSGGSSGWDPSWGGDAGGTGANGSTINPDAFTGTIAPEAPTRSGTQRAEDPFNLFPGNNSSAVDPVGTAGGNIVSDIGSALGF